MTFVHSFDIKVHFASFKPSRKTKLWSSSFGAQKRDAFDRLFGGRVAWQGLRRRRVQWHCPRAPTQDPSKGRQPKNRHSPHETRNGLSVWFPPFSGWPGSLVLLPGPGLVPVCFLFLLLFLSIGRGRHVPAPGWDGRRVKSKGTDTRTGTGCRPKDRLFQVPSMYDYLAYLIVPDLFFALRFAFYFPRMLWALQWLSSPPAVPSSVVQDKPGERFLWMEEDALDGLSFNSPRVRSNVCFVGCPCQSACEALDFKRSL